MHYVINLKVPTVIQLRTIYLASICFPEEAITTALHITFSTGLIRQQALFWHSGFPSLTMDKHHSLLLRGSGPDTPDSLKSLHRSTRTLRAQVCNRKNSYYRPMRTMGCKCWDSSPAPSSFICCSPLSIPIQLFQ